MKHDPKPSLLLFRFGVREFSYLVLFCEREKGRQDPFFPDSTSFLCARHDERTVAKVYPCLPPTTTLDKEKNCSLPRPFRRFHPTGLQGWFVGVRPVPWSPRSVRHLFHRSRGSPRRSGGLCDGSTPTPSSLCVGGSSSKT